MTQITSTTSLRSETTSRQCSFHNNNFAEQYRERFAAEPDFFRPNYRAPLPRHTTAAIVQYLQALRDLIARNDSERIEEQIMELYMTHRREYSFFLKELRDWILGRLPLAPADSLHNRRPGPVFHRQEPDGLDPVHDKENIAPTGPPGQTTNLAILKLRGRLDNVLQSLAY
jgi:hypothetical protein